MTLSFAGTDAGGEGDHIGFEKFCPHHLWDYVESVHKVPWATGWLETFDAGHMLQLYGHWMMKTDDG